MELVCKEIDGILRLQCDIEFPYAVKR